MIKYRTMVNLVAILARGTIPSPIIHYWWKNKKDDLVADFNQILSQSLVGTVFMVAGIASAVQTILYGLATKSLSSIFETWWVLIPPSLCAVMCFFFGVLNGFEGLGCRAQHFTEQYIELERALQEAPAGETLHERVAGHMLSLKVLPRTPVDELRFQTLQDIYQSFGLIDKTGAA